MDADAVEAQMLQTLAQAASSFTDEFGNRLSSGERLARQERFFRVKAEVDARKLAEKTLDEEIKATQAQTELAREVEHRKLDIEEEKVQVAKAEVVVKALGIAAAAGVQPEQLLTMIHGFSRGLLPGLQIAGPETLQIEAKKPG